MGESGRVAAIHHSRQAPRIRALDRAHAHRLTDYDRSMGTESTWRCPLCGAYAKNGAAHIKAKHPGGPGAVDRFGLRSGLPATGPRRQPPSTRPARHNRGRRGLPVDAGPDVEPARRTPLPSDAGVLRLLCESLEGRDAGSLQARLAELPGVEAAAIDLYDRTVDLFIDPRRAAPPHLVALTTERLGLPVVGAELHRRPPAGASLGDQSRLLVLF